MDIFEFAMEKEKYAEHFYRELADRSRNPGLTKILNMLADEEVKHYEIVQDMQSHRAGHLTATPVLQNAQEIFTKMKDGVEKFDFDVSEANLYRKASEIEKQSRDFYLEKADEVQDEGQKAIFKQLAGEEEKHLLLVQRIGDFVARPETFLENAEMYHFDDYVGGEF
jgi:rubrerythrin